MSRKYVDDYRLDNVLGPNGKLKTVPVYCGDWYEFEADEETVRKTKLRYVVLTALAVASLLYLLIFTNHIGHYWYVAAPLALSTIFLFFAALSTWRLRTANGPVTREHKNKTHDRMATMSLFTTVLAGLCFVGCIYHLIAVEFGVLQLIFTLVAGLYTACALLMFLGRGALRMKLSDKPRRTVGE